MKINDEFEAHEVKVVRSVVRLFRNGEPIVDEHGQPKDFESLDDACHVATHWDQFQAPTYAGLREMSDDQLLQRLTRSTR